MSRCDTRRLTFGAAGRTIGGMNRTDIPGVYLLGAAVGIALIWFAIRSMFGGRK